MALSILPIFGATPAMAGTTVEYVNVRTIVSVDFGGTQGNPTVSGDNTPSGTQVVLDGRITNGAFAGGGGGNRHRLFFLTFDLANYMNILDELDSLTIGMHADLGGGGNANSNFNVYLLTSDLTMRITQSDIPTYGAARNLGLITYRSNLVWQQTGVPPASPMNSPNILPHVLEYFANNPGQTIVGLKFFGTSDVTVFVPNTNLTYGANGRPLRPHLEVSYAPELVPIANVGEELEQLFPRAIYTDTFNLGLATTWPGFGGTISWQSSRPDVINNSGVLVNRPGFHGSSTLVQFEATVTLNNITRVFTYETMVLRQGSFPGTETAVVNNSMDISFNISSNVSGVTGYVLRVPNSYLVPGDYYTLHSANGTLISRFIANMNETTTQIDVSNFVSGNSANFALAATGNGRLRDSDDLFILDGVDDDIRQAMNALAMLDLGDTSAVIRNMTLPPSINGVTIRWQSSNQEFLGNNGRVDRPFAGEGDAHVALAAIATVGGYTFSRVFSVTILRQDGGAGFRELRDPQHITDEAFFGVWNPNLNNGLGGWVPQQVFRASMNNWAGGWVTYNHPVLRYDLLPDLRYVMLAAQRGDYDEARAQLLVYYRNRDLGRTYEVPMRPNFFAAEMMAEDIFGWWQLDIPVAMTHIGPEWRWHTIDIDLTPLGYSVPRSFFLMDSDMDGSAIEIKSRRWGNGQYGAEMLIMVDGVQRTFPVHADMFISAGANSDVNFGNEEILLVREALGEPQIHTDVHGRTSIIPTPFGDDTARTYLHFNLPDMGRITSMQLRFYARSDVDRDKKMFVFFPRSQQVLDTVFNEHAFTWDGHFPMIFNYKLTGYIWHAGISSLWNLEAEWLNVGPRLQPIQWMLERYLRTEEEIFGFKALEYVIEMYTQQSDVGFPRRLDAGWRVANLNSLLFGMLDSSLMTPEILTALLKYIHEHVRVGGLQAVSVGGAFNQVLAQLYGSFHAMGWHPEIRIDGEWERAKTSLVNLFDIYLNPDGSYPESTSGYILGVLREMLAILEIISIHEEEDNHHYAAMIRHFQMLARYFVDMTMPARQMQPWGSGGRHDGITAVYQQLYQRFPLVDPYGFTAYLQSNGERGTRPYWYSVLYPWKAIAFMRSGWGRNDYGATINTTFGGSHSHPDDLGLDVWAYGRAMLVEVGGSGYVQGSPVSQIMTQTSSHNTIEINNRNQLRHPGNINFNQPQRMLLATNRVFDFLHAGSDKIWPRYQDHEDIWQAGFEAHRKVFFVHNRFWIVSDFIFPDDNDAHTYRQIWRPDTRNFLSIDPVTKAMTTNYANSPQIQVVPADPHEIIARNDRGFMISPQHGEEIADFVSYLRVDHVGPATFDTLLFPDRQGQQTFVAVNRIPLNVPTYVATSLRINIGQNTGFFYSGNDFHPGFPPEMRFSATVWNPPAPLPPGWERPRWYAGMPDWREFNFPTRSFDRFTTDGQMAYVELDVNNNLAMIALTKGTTLTRDGEDLVSFDGRLADLGVRWEHRTMFIDTESRTLPENGVRIVTDTQVDRVIFNGVSVQFTTDGNAITTNGRTPVPPPQIPPNAPPIGSDPPIGRPDGGGNLSAPGAGNNVNQLPPLPPLPPINGGDNGNVSDLPFADIENHWAREEILRMYARGVVNGVADHEFAPNSNITRAQFTTILVRALGIPLYTNNGNGDIFNDVNGIDWFASAVAAAYNAGLVSGYNGTFRPNDEISRQEMAIMLMTAFEMMNLENDHSADLSIFADASLIADWAYDAVAGAVGAGLMSGVGNDEFSPLTSATRAQATVVISRLLDLSPTSERGLD